ncbi:hypothetical protein WA171_006066 [Blastocystis sp. BT1]
MLPICGIDFGTCFSCVYVFKDNHFVPVPSETGENTYPTYYSIHDGYEYFGEAAKRSASRFPECTVFDIKRILGLTYKEVVEVIERTQYGFSILIDQNERPYIYLQEPNGTQHCFYPEYFVTKFISYLVGRASSFIGEDVRECVITVPAYFTLNQKNAILWGASQACVHVQETFPEPCAAALAYQVVAVNGICHVVIFDLGGGTFDTTLMRIVQDNIQVLMSDGDPFLGGQDFDNHMMLILMQVLVENNVDVRVLSLMQLQELRAEAERIKKELSVVCDVDFDMTRFNYHPVDEDDDGEVVITRDIFEAHIKNDVYRAVCIVSRCLKRANLTLSEGDSILLVGGSSRIPLVQKMLESCFPGVNIRFNGNPDEIVANGACALSRKTYCESHNIGLDDHTPTVHTIVIRKVEVQFDDDAPTTILPVGTLTSVWKQCAVKPSFSNAFRRKDVKIRVLEVDEQGNKKVIGAVSVKAHIGRKVFIEMMVDKLGRLAYKYGVEGYPEDDKAGLIPFQAEMTKEKAKLVNHSMSQSDLVAMKAQKTLKQYILYVETKAGHPHYTKTKEYLNQVLIWLQRCIGTNADINVINSTVTNTYNWLNQCFALHVC